jgi:hypothetical protein
MNNFFTQAEMKCKCKGPNCPGGIMQSAFMAKLNNLRGTYYRKPLTVASGYRCKAHDKTIGGSGKNHPQGFAVDLIVAKGQDLMDAVIAAQAVGIRRVIVYHNKPHIHLDDNPDLTPGLYVY